jgi:hypothetical protein
MKHVDALGIIPRRDAVELELTQLKSLVTALTARFDKPPTPPTPPATRVTQERATPGRDRSLDRDRENSMYLVDSDMTTVPSARALVRTDSLSAEKRTGSRKRPREVSLEVTTWEGPQEQTLVGDTTGPSAGSGSSEREKLETGPGIVEELSAGSTELNLMGGEEVIPSFFFADAPLGFPPTTLNIKSGLTQMHVTMGNTIQKVMSSKSDQLVLKGWLDEITSSTIVTKRLGQLSRRRLRTWTRLKGSQVFIDRPGDPSSSKGLKVPLMRAIKDSINWDFWTSVASFETLQTHKEGWNIERAQSIMPMDIMMLVHNSPVGEHNIRWTPEGPKFTSPDRKFPKGHGSPKKNNSGDLCPPAETKMRRVEEPKKTADPKEKDLSKRKCFNCNKPGHLKKDCPEDKKKGLLPEECLSSLT